MSGFDRLFIRAYGQRERLAAAATDASANTSAAPEAATADPYSQSYVPSATPTRQTIIPPAKPVLAADAAHEDLPEPAAARRRSRLNRTRLATAPAVEAPPRGATRKSNRRPRRDWSEAAELAVVEIPASAPVNPRADLAPPLAPLNEPPESPPLAPEPQSAAKAPLAPPSAAKGEKGAKSNKVTYLLDRPGKKRTTLSEAMQLAAIERAAEERRSTPSAQEFAATECEPEISSELATDVVIGAPQTAEPPVEKSPTAVVETALQRLAPAAETAGPHIALNAGTRQRERVQPMLQVDGFVFPAICTKLLERSAAAFDKLASELAAAAAAHHKTLLVSGFRRGEGRTSFVLTLAQLLVRSGARVVVVDGHLASPQLAERLRVRPELGWDAVVRGEQPLDEVLVESVADGLTICPLTHRVAEPKELLESYRLDVMLRVLRESYDVVLIDGAPAEGEAPTPHWPLAAASPIDWCILVRDIRGQTPADLPAAAEWLDARQVRLLGVIENFGPES